MDKLLTLLSKNARLTDAQLAVMLGEKEQDIAAKRAEYERTGVICGYKAVVDWEKTPQESVVALIEVRVTPKRDFGFDEIARRIMEFPEVQSLWLISGSYDLAVIISGDSFKDVALFVSRRLSLLDSVLSTATNFVLRRYKEDGVCFIGDEPDERGVTSF